MLSKLLVVSPDARGTFWLFWSMYYGFRFKKDSAVKFGSVSVKENDFSVRKWPLTLGRDANPVSLWREPLVNSDLQPSWHFCALEFMSRDIIC